MRRCIVPDCKNSRGKDRVSFYSVPTNKVVRLQWKKAIENAYGKILDWLKINRNNARICSAHFHPDDLTPLSDGLHLRRKNSVPSIFKNSAGFPMKDGLFMISKPVPTFDEQFSGLCRVCLKDVGLSELTLDHTLPKSSISITVAVKTAFDIDLTLNPDFPQRCCARCYNLITTSYVLKREFIKTDIKLRQARENYNPIIEILPYQTDDTLVAKITEKNQIAPSFEVIFNKDINYSDDIIMKDEPEEEKVIQEQPIFANAIYSDTLNIKEEDESEDEENVQYIAIIQEDIEKEEVIDVNKMLEKAIKQQNESQKEQKKYEKWPEEKKAKRLPKSSRSCKKCGIWTDHLLDLFRHVDESKEGCVELYSPNFECFICRKKFMLKTMKETHVIRDHNDLELTGKCTHCGLYRDGLKNIVFYEDHMRRHLSPPKYECKICDKGFFRNEVFQAHMNHHKNNFWYYCDLCDYRGKAKMLIFAHLKNHFREKSEPINLICDRCSRSFSDSVRLKKHIFRIHKTCDDGCYLCESCDYCFINYNMYLQHVSQCDGSKRRFPPNIVRVQHKDLDPKCLIKTCNDI